MTTHKTKGIVFTFFKYKETSIICRIFTEKFGVRSYMIKGIRKKKSTIAFYQPLTQLELLVTERENRDI
ncbi:MAG: recombination protein O N-terminal domain-containing protein, partial [Bacteroidota bacterium]